MTAHELAKKLLEGPNETVVIYKDSDYCEINSLYTISSITYYPRAGYNDQETNKAIKLSHFDQ